MSTENSPQALPAIDSHPLVSHPLLLSVKLRPRCILPWARHFPSCLGTLFDRLARFRGPSLSLQLEVGLSCKL